MPTTLWVMSRDGHLVGLGPSTGPGDLFPPTPPAGLSASNVTTSGCVLSWRPSADDTGVAGYEVWREGTPSTRVAAGIVTTSRALTGLTPGTRYRFYVKAVDAAGNASAASQAVTVDTAASDPPPTQSAVYIGGVPALGDISESATARVNRVDAELGGMAVVRLYIGSSESPSTWSAIGEAAAVDALGAAVWLSIARPYSAQVPSGGAAYTTYATWLQAFAQTLPSDRPVWLTTHHEPENDGVTAATWRGAYERFYDLVKAVRPDVRVGPCYMSFHWNPGRNIDLNGGPDAWTPVGRFDFAATDTYSINGNPPRSLQEHTGHQRWHAHFSQYGKPLHIPERGVDRTHPDATDTLIAQIILADEAWMPANGYEAVAWWQKAGGLCELLPGSQSRAAWTATASRGRQP